MTSIAQKILAGALWTTLGNFSIRIIGTISVILLARVLTPEDYGIVAKAVLLHSFLELFTQLGVEASLVQNQKATSEDYNTAWTINILRGCFIAALLCFMAPFAADYFREERLDDIIYVYALSTLIFSVSNIGTVDFRKNFQFNLDFKYRLVSKLASFSTTLSIAFSTQSYWAFPIGVLVGKLVDVVFSYILSRYRPALSLSQWKNLFHFSKWMLGMEAANAVTAKTDGFILGRLDSTHNLGLYTLSSEIAHTATTEIAMPVARAAFPAQSKIQGQAQDFKYVNDSLFSMVLLIVIPLSTGVAALSHRVESILLGNVWEGAAALITIIAFSSIANSISGLAVPTFLATGRVKELALLCYLRLALRISILYVGFKAGGVVGLSYGILATGCLHSAILFRVMHRLSLVSAPSILRRSARFVVASALMFTALTQFPLFEVAGTIGHQISSAGAEIVLGASIFFICLFISHKLFPGPSTPEALIFRKYILPKLKLGVSRV